MRTLKTVGDTTHATPVPSHIHLPEHTEHVYHSASTLQPPTPPQHSSTTRKKFHKLLQNPLQMPSFSTTDLYNGFRSAAIQTTPNSLSFSSTASPFFLTTTPSKSITKRETTFRVNSPINNTSHHQSTSAFKMPFDQRHLSVSSSIMTPFKSSSHSRVLTSPSNRMSPSLLFSQLPKNSITQSPQSINYKIACSPQLNKSYQIVQQQQQQQQSPKPFDQQNDYMDLILASQPTHSINSIPYHPKQKLHKLLKEVSIDNSLNLQQSQTSKPTMTKKNQPIEVHDKELFRLHMKSLNTSTNIPAAFIPFSNSSRKSRTSLQFSALPSVTDRQLIAHSNRKESFPDVEQPLPLKTHQETKIQYSASKVTQSQLSSPRVGIKFVSKSKKSTLLPEQTLDANAIGSEADKRTLMNTIECIRQDVSTMNQYVNELKGLYNSEIHLRNVIMKIPGFDSIVHCILFEDDNSSIAKISPHTRQSLSNIFTKGEQHVVDTRKGFRAIISLAHAKDTLAEHLQLCGGQQRGNVASSSSLAEFSMNMIEDEEALFGLLPLLRVKEIQTKLSYFTRCLHSLLQTKRGDHLQQSVDGLKLEIEQIGMKTQQQMRAVQQKVPQKVSDAREMRRMEQNIAHILDRKNYMKQQPFIDQFEGKEDALGGFGNITEYNREQSKAINQMADVLRDFQKFV